MTGMQSMQAGTALSGDLVGGIGSLIAAENYKRPRLPPAVGPELRLRQLAQSQLLGGGEQLLGGTALYNQLAPILMSQLPGMTYHPGGGATGSGTGAQASQIGDPGGAQTSPMASYQQALQNYQNQQALLQQKQSMKAQLKGMSPGAAKKSLRQQFKGVKRQIKSTPDAATLERQQYLAGSQPGAYDIRMDGGGGTGAGAGTPGSSLGSINDLLAGLSGNGGQNFLQQYQQGLGGSGGTGMPSDAQSFHDIAHAWDPGMTPNFRPQFLDQYLRSLDPGTGGGLGSLAGGGMGGY